VARKELKSGRAFGAEETEGEKIENEKEKIGPCPNMRAPGTIEAT
jgi:hypothetical protein